MGEEGGRLYTYRYTLIVRDKVTRQCPQTTTFEEKGEPKRNRTEIPLFTILTPYHWVKPVYMFEEDLGMGWGEGQN